MEFALEEDADDAIDNMDGSELLGKTLKCNVAKALPKVAHGQAVWNSEDFHTKDDDATNGDVEYFAPTNAD